MLQMSGMTTESNAFVNVSKIFSKPPFDRRWCLDIIGRAIWEWEAAALGDGAKPFPPLGGDADF